MASTSNPAANKGKAPALYGDDDDDDRRHHDMVMKMTMMREERVSMGIPPGWRFCPTDEELIMFYLINRTWNNSRIIRLDIYDFTPMQLAGLILSPSRSPWSFSLISFFPIFLKIQCHVRIFIKKCEYKLYFVNANTHAHWLYFSSVGTQKNI